MSDSAPRRLMRLSIRRRSTAARDIDEEIQMHLDLRTAQLIAQGWSPEEAAAEARRRFGSSARRQKLRLAARRREGVLWRRDVLDALSLDISNAVRRVRRAPGFAIAVVLTFALGIGANASMFGIIDRLLLRPPAHIANPDAVVNVDATIHDGGATYVRHSQSYAAFRDLRARVPAFASVAAQTYPTTLAIGRGAEARSAPGLQVTGAYFRTFGVRPAVGRFFEWEDGDDAPNVVVISHRLWQKEFAGEPSVIGQMLDLGKGRFAIVGVAPPGFVGADLEPIDVWIPLDAPAAPALAFPGWRTVRQVSLLRIRARLSATGTPTMAAAQATAVFRAGEHTWSGGDTLATIGLESIVPRRAGAYSMTARVALLLTAVSTVVLLIACANIANLLLTSVAGRRREIAVRLALGVSRRRLAVQLLLETLMLAGAGGVVALGVVALGGPAVRGFFLSDVAWPDRIVDSRTFAFTAITTLAVGILAGLVPALRGAPDDLTRELRFGTPGAPQSVLRTALVLAQTTLSVVLLVGMGAFVQSLHNVTSLPLNIDIDRIVVAAANLQGAGFDTAATASAYRTLAARAATVPGVASVALVEGLPFHSRVATRFRLPGRDSIAALAHRDVRMIAVTADYFATAGTPLISGHVFHRGTTTQRVAIVNDLLARLVWPGESPLGKCIIVGFGDQPCAEVIGVAAATRGFDGEGEIDPQVYVPLDNGAHLLPARVVVIRLASDASGIGAPLQQTLQRAIPNLPYVDAAPMRSLIASTVAPSRLGASLLGVFGGLALLLSAIGLYGTTSYVVRQRMSEMGVRLALGASRASMLRLVIGRALIVTTIGLVVGLVIAIATQREVAPLLFRTTMHELGLLVGVSVVVTVVAFLAALGPAVRAARADPLASLRSE